LRERDCNERTAERGGRDREGSPAYVRVIAENSGERKPAVLLGAIIRTH
jgi:hypothetical protein